MIYNIYYQFGWKQSGNESANKVLEKYLVNGHIYTQCELLLIKW